MELHTQDEDIAGTTTYHADRSCGVFLTTTTTTTRTTGFCDGDFADDTDCDDNNYDLCSNCNNYISNILSSSSFFVDGFTSSPSLSSTRGRRQKADEQERRRCSCGFIFYVHFRSNSFIIIVAVA